MNLQNKEIVYIKDVYVLKYVVIILLATSIHLSRF